MDGGSEGEGNRNVNQSSSEGPKKPKRQMKTPFQLETLERVYASMPSLSFTFELHFLIWGLFKLLLDVEILEILVYYAVHMCLFAMCNEIRR